MLSIGFLLFFSLSIKVSISSASSQLIDKCGINEKENAIHDDVVGHLHAKVRKAEMADDEDNEEHG